MSQLRVENISTSHLPTINMRVGDAECIGLSGPSGMGKSLLLRVIADLDPHQGKVWLDDEEQATIPATTWRSRVGLLVAESAWWSEKVTDHFDVVDEQAMSLLGFEPGCLDWTTDRLSSGEKQRLALLRLLSRKPELLLLDEPTANLDPDSVEKVEVLIRKYQKQHGASIIWVSHDLNQLQRMTSRRYQLTSDGLHEVRD